MEGDTKKTPLSIFPFRVTSPCLVTVTSLILSPALALEKYGLILFPGWRYLSRTEQTALRPILFPFDLFQREDEEAATLEGDGTLVY